MDRIIYLAVSPFFYLFSILPFRLLYLFSDILYLIVYKLIGYRSELVRANLVGSFPEKSEKEIKEIEKKFYHSFFDIILETFKIGRLSPDTIRKRMEFVDTGVFEQYLQQGKSVIMVMGHYGNWEFSGAGFHNANLHELYAIYHPLHNEYINQLVVRSRNRAGVKLFPMRNALQSMRKIKDKVTATVFIADQSPYPKNAIWLDFLNRLTPFFRGFSKAAKIYNYPVIYIRVNRLKRGYYRIEPVLLCDKPLQYSDKELTSLFIDQLERDIRSKPELWLWTHNRWKHEFKPGIHKLE